MAAAVKAVCLRYGWPSALFTSNCLLSVFRRVHARLSCKVHHVAFSSAMCLLITHAIAALPWPFCQNSLLGDCSYTHGSLFPAASLQSSDVWLLLSISGMAYSVFRLAKHAGIGKAGVALSPRRVGGSALLHAPGWTLYLYLHGIWAKHTAAGDPQLAGHVRLQGWV